MIIFNLKTISRNRYYYPFGKMSRWKFKGTPELLPRLRVELLDLTVAANLLLGSV